MTANSWLAAGTLCVTVLPSAFLIGGAKRISQIWIPEDEMPQPPLDVGSTWEVVVKEPHKTNTQMPKAHFILNTPLDNDRSANDDRLAC
jgi:hypothetical protein